MRWIETQDGDFVNIDKLEHIEIEFVVDRPNFKYEIWGITNDKTYHLGAYETEKVALGIVRQITQCPDTFGKK